jgi:hypothetical protein
VKPGGIRFAEYGQSGDSVSARRTRHAFRYLVLAMIALTFSLWLAENYLRYPKPERLYRMALTHERDSARALLRNLVPPQDTAIPQDPRLARYLAALAFIEDGKFERERLGIHEEYAVDPLVIERYEQAYQADRRSEFILLSYACALFLDAQYAKARDLFRDARGVSEPPNALAAYLEAAARAALGELPEAYNLVSQANALETAVVRLPQPLWHSSMPRHGVWYARMREEVTERFLTPLFELQRHVLAAIQERERAGATPPPSQTGATPESAPPAIDALAWLRQLEGIGQRMLIREEGGGHEPDLLRAITAVNFQYEALRLRAQLEPNAPPEVHARLDRLGKAREMLEDFGAARPARHEAHRMVVGQPVRLSVNTFLWLFVAYVAAYLLAKLADAGRMYWALPHPRWAQAGVTLLMAALLALLFVFTAIMRFTQAPTPVFETATYLWYAVLTLVVGLGLLYPHFALPPATQAAPVSGSDMPEGEVLLAARRARRIAYAALLRRYYGIAFGGFVVVFCVWVLGFRIAVGLYPLLEQKLLVTGLQTEAGALIEQVRQLLQ